MTGPHDAATWRAMAREAEAEARALEDLWAVAKARADAYHTEARRADELAAVKARRAAMDRRHADMVAEDHEAGRVRPGGVKHSPGRVDDCELCASMLAVRLTCDDR